MGPFLILLLALIAVTRADEINRQSIIFHEETPDVFYCPQEKAISLEGMIVRSKSLKKLCEHEGRPLPEDYKSDCWNDVDETDYACSEKKRILLKLTPPGSENAIIDNFVPIFRKDEYKFAPDFKNQMEEKHKKAEDKKAKKAEDKKTRVPKHDF